MFAFRQSILTTLVFLMAGCVSSPEVVLDDVSLQSVGFKQMDILLDFEMKNPNSFSLPLESIAWSMRVNGQRFEGGVVPIYRDLEPEDSLKIVVPVTLPYASALTVAVDVIRQGQLPYILEGSLKFDTCIGELIVPFERSGTWSLPFSQGRVRVILSQSALRRSL